MTTPTCHWCDQPATDCCDFRLVAVPVRRPSGKVVGILPAFCELPMCAAHRHPAGTTRYKGLGRRGGWRTRTLWHCPDRAMARDEARLVAAATGGEK